MPIETHADPVTMPSELAGGATKATIFVTGDSTTGLNPPSEKTGLKVSWADVFQDWIETEKTSYHNEAVPGFTMRDFFHRGRLEEIFHKTKPGDVILACHGHLESAPLVRRQGRARGCLPGAGDETTTVFDKFFNREETVHTFGWYVKEYIGKSLARGVTLVLLSPAVRCAWVEGKIYRTKSRHYADVMQKVSMELGGRYLDFSTITENHLNGLGQEQSRRLFLDDDEAHTNREGAKLYAQLLAASLREKYPEIFAARLKRDS